MYKQVLRSLVLLAGASMFSTMTWADGVEVSGYGGGVWYGLGVGNHGLFGGAAAFPIGDNDHIFGEFSYTSNLVQSIFSSLGASGTGSSHIAHFVGGVDHSFRPAGSRVRPYVLAAVGLEHGSVSVTSVEGIPVAASGGANGLIAEFGGGVRIYIRPNWGIKPEARYIRDIATGPGANSAQYTIGVFYQFRH